MNKLIEKPEDFHLPVIKENALRISPRGAATVSGSIVINS
jgi:hypothetical protein